MKNFTGNYFLWSRFHFLVIPTGAKRSGGTCGSADPSMRCFSTERSASQIYRVNSSQCAESKDLRVTYPTHAVRTLSTTEPTPCGTPPFFPQGESKHYSPEGKSCSRAESSKSFEHHRQYKHGRGPSTARSKRGVTQ